MPTLASIPESSTAPSHLDADESREQSQPQTVSFERAHPRTRVMVIPRRPSRGRKPAFKTTALANAHGMDNAGRRAPQPHEGDEKTLRSTESLEGHHNDYLATAGAAHDEVSALDSPVKQTFEPSEASVDLDSFPAPPSNENTIPEFSFSANPVPEDLKKVSRPSSAAPPVEVGPRQQQSRHARERDGVARKNDEDIRYWTGDGAADSVRRSRQSSVDSALVDAISRNVARQLRSFSVASQLGNPSHSPRRPSGPYHTMYEAESRTSSQRRDLRRFTRELQKYADMTGARGKVPNFTPTPTPDGTLRTVSALMPFRDEFRSAGLAVTSRDQAQRRPHNMHRFHPARGSRNSTATAEGRILSATQYDGNAQLDGNAESRNAESRQTRSPHSEMSLGPSKGVDEWRYALIDEVPPEKPKRPGSNTHGRFRCFPCAGNEDQTTDGEGSHFNAVLGNPLNKARDAAAPAMPKIRPPSTRETSGQPRSAPPRMQPHDAGLGQLGPRQRLGEPVRATPHRPIHHPQADGRMRTTGLRRPSMQAPLGASFDARHSPDRFPRDPRPYRKRDPGPKTRAELAQLGQVLPFPPPRDQSQNKTSPQRHQNLATREPARGALKERPAHARKDESGSTLPDMPCAWASNTTSSLEEAMVRAAASVTKKENEPPGRTASIATRKSKRDTISAKPNKRTSTSTSGTKGMTGRASRRPSIPRRTSSIREGMPSAELERENREITDRDVLRGLRIAVSAACDEEVDVLIRNKTGLQIRRFLADLMAFESLDEKPPEDDKEQQARKRRSEMRKVKQRVRRSRELRKSGQ